MSMVPALESLPRPTLLPIAFDHMLSGMIVTQAMMPLVVFAGADDDLMNQVAIDEWMGASTLYTHRMRRLMGIEGDDVGAIMKALQLDVGFVHQYMDVRYELIDANHAEFWLNHCGALLDVEPFGEERVFGMCHTIEDPTFDATALATNPRARIRPIHRPPRTPADRHPHCHWTIAIDPDNDPVGPIALMQRIESLPLGSVPNERPTGRDTSGVNDYAGPFDPEFRLADLSDAALVAVAREFQMQAHLLMAATDLALADHFDAEQIATIMRDSWNAAGWIVSERLVRTLGADSEHIDADVIASVLALTPMLPPGLAREIERHDDGASVRLAPSHDGIFDPAHAGWCGLLARGEQAGIAGILHGIDRRIALDEWSMTSDGVVFGARLQPDAAPAPIPPVVGINRGGRVALWKFDTSEGPPEGALARLAD